MLMRMLMRGSMRAVRRVAYVTCLRKGKRRKGRVVQSARDFLRTPTATDGRFVVQIGRHDRLRAVGSLRLWN